MSDCRNGGRTVYEKTAFDQSPFEQSAFEQSSTYEPPEHEDNVLRGRIVFKDGTDLPLSYYRMGREVERFEMDGVRFVPEQQEVDATLGRVLLTAEQIADAVLDNFEETHEKNYDQWEPSKFDWQAIADELNATLGKRAWRNSYDEEVE